MSYNIDFNRRPFIGAALAAFAIPELVVGRSVIRTASSREASGTTCRRKRLERLPMP
jgi:hypothetical protein